ncbi:MAG: GHKL domain-containing protein [Planctomycetes bacterium]|nr:GHKL domain-containing protein [Planctomycetota bacterium]
MIRRLLAAHPLGLSLALVLVVFLVDLSLPLGVASAVPYTFAVLLALSARPGWFGPAVAGLCGVLTIAKMELVPERGSTEMWKVIVNRCLALFAISMTLLLGMLRRQATAERARAEERVAEHQADLAHMGRLSLLGQLAAGLAHELNQPLAAVCLQADIAARLAEPGTPVRQELAGALSEITEQSSRAAEIVRSIRRMARRTDPGCDPIDLNEAVRTVARLLDWHAHRSGVVVELHLANDPVGPTFGDRVQIEQVLFNLIQNAIEAIVERGDGPRTITIDTVDGRDVLIVTVRDTGIGIKNPERVFERFYTTKPSGMGMGLAISRSIIEAHGGTMRAVSVADGAVFSFTLPVARKENP